jgi:hypothetical protein
MIDADSIDAFQAATPLHRASLAQADAWASSRLTLETIHGF